MGTILLIALAIWCALCDFSKKENSQYKKAIFLLNMCLYIYYLNHATK